MVSGGGVPRFGRGVDGARISARIPSPATASILSYEDTNINGAEINLGTQRRPQSVPQQQRPAGRHGSDSGLFITRNSYTSTGCAMVRANFRFPNNPTNYVGSSAAPAELANCWSARRRQCRKCPAPFTVDADFGIAGDGTAYLLARPAARRASSSATISADARSWLAWATPCLARRSGSFSAAARTPRASGSTRTAPRSSASLSKTAPAVPVLRPRAGR